MSKDVRKKSKREEMKLVSMVVEKERQIEEGKVERQEKKEIVEKERRR